MSGLPPPSMQAAVAPPPPHDPPEDAAGAISTTIDQEQEHKELIQSPAVTPPYSTAPASPASTPGYVTPPLLVGPVAPATVSRSTAPGPPIRLSSHVAARTDADVIVENVDHDQDHNSNDKLIMSESEKSEAAEGCPDTDDLLNPPSTSGGLPSALLNLPPPPPFDLEVKDLTVGVPYNPLAWWEWYATHAASWFGGDASPAPDDKETMRRKTILAEVSCACDSGEVLAM